MADQGHSEDETFIKPVQVHAGLKDTNVTTAVLLGDASNASYNTANKTIIGSANTRFTYCGSAGMITGGVLSDAGSETIDVTGGTGFFRTTDSHTGILVELDWSAASGLAIPTDTIRYVGVEYNAGAPQVFLKTSDTWNRHTEFRLGSIANEGGTLHVLTNPWQVSSVDSHMIERFFETRPFERADRIGGITLGETGTRNITVTAGEIYDLTNEFAIDAFDSSGSDTFDTYLGTVVDTAGATQWDNDNYNNGGVKTSLTVNRYANLWFYVEADGGVVCVYGTAQYTTAATAGNEGVPSSIPLRLQAHGKLIGRLTFRKGEATATAIESAFNGEFSPTLASDHGNLAGLGDDDHAQYLLLAGRAGQTITDDITITGSLAVDNLSFNGNNITTASGQNLYILASSANVGIVPDLNLHIGAAPTTDVTQVSIVGDSGAITDSASITYFNNPDKTYPIRQEVSLGHDNMAYYFDAYTSNGTNQLSSDAGSNFKIEKKSDELTFNYDSGIAQGAAVTWNEAFKITTSGLDLPAASVAEVGHIDGYVVSYNTTTAVTITAGSVEANGAYYTLASDASHSMTSLAAGFDHHYIYIDDDASTAPTAVIIDATTEPAWSDSKRGWYNGDDRCIGSVVSPAAAATILYFDSYGRVNSVQYFYGTDLFPACATNLNPSGAWQTPNTNESSVLCPVNSKLLHGTAYFQDVGGSCRFYAASNEKATVNAVGNSDVTLYAEVLARRSFTVSLGASRNIKITGENDDDNVLGVVVQGFLTDR
jgi:hypothetical protein